VSAGGGYAEIAPAGEVERRGVPIRANAAASTNNVRCVLSE